MFGYIRPQISELLVREYEQYKGVYCSLCKELGKRYGVLSRLTLSYDCTFLSLLLLAQEEACIPFRQGRCVVNPLKRCTFCSTRHPAFAFSSALSVLMTYYHVKDDLEDSGFFGRLRARLLLPLVYRPRKKAAKEYPELAEILSGTIGGQSQVEKETPSLDACAEPTAKLLSGVFRLAAGDDPERRRVMESFGYFLGRWVYFMDAADDMEKDWKKKEFNPFLHRLQLAGENPEAAIEDSKLYCNEVLNATLSQALAAFHLLRLPHYSSIVENILEQGLPAMQKKLLFEKEKKEHVRSV